MKEISDYNVGFNTGIKIGRDFWFPSINGNALLRWDGEKTHYIGSFPEEKKDDSCLYVDVKKYKNLLFFIPFVAKNIAIYDLEYKCFRTMPLEYEYKRGMFSNSVIYEKKLYMFPCYFNGIIRLNLENYNMEVLDDWVKDIKGYNKEEGIPFFYVAQSKRAKNKVYIPFVNTHAILEFDLKNETTKIYDINLPGVIAMTQYEGTFWMISKNGDCIISWKPDKGELCRLTDFPMGYIKGLFFGSICYEDSCFFFPYDARVNMVLEVKMSTGEIIENPLFSDLCQKKYDRESIDIAHFIFCICEGDFAILYSGITSEILIYNLKEKSINKMCLRVPEIYREEYAIINEKFYFHRMKWTKYHQEVKSFNLLDYINEVEIGSGISRENNLQGRTIYREILK